MAREQKIDLRVTGLSVSQYLIVRKLVDDLSEPWGGSQVTHGRSLEQEENNDPIRIEINLFDPTEGSEHVDIPDREL